MYEVSVKRHFSAAHCLHEVGGKCEELHGHNFFVEVSVAGNALDDHGLLLDFRLLKKWIDESLVDLDHRFLNEAAPFKGANPSAEHIARLLHARLSAKAADYKLLVSRITVWESDDSRVTYTELP
jgi:6-pyruvoyltetrahydropterin/6-carboxytetrahydropterin synthase